MLDDAVTWLRAHRSLVLLVPILLLALTVRLWAVYEHLPECPVGYDSTTSSLAQCFHIEGDRAYLVGQADALADGTGFVSPGVSDIDGAPTPGARYLPLFPLFLGTVRWMGYEDVTALRVATILLGTGTVFLIGVAARVAAKVKRDRAMALAALFAALYPPLWLNEANLQVEALLAPACALALIATMLALRQATTRRLVALGLTAGMLSLIRLDGLIIGVALIAVVAVVALRGVDRRERIRHTAIPLGIVALMLLPWMAYNLNRFSRPVVLTTGSEVSMLSGSCDATFMGDAVGSWDRSCLPASWTAYEDDDAVAARSQATAFVGDNLTQLPKVVAARVARLWGAWAPVDTAERELTLEGRSTSATVVGFGLLYAGLVAAAAGLVHLRRRGAPISPFVVLLAVPTVAAATTFAVMRVRTPADVAVTALAGVGIAALTRRWTIFPPVEALEPIDLTDEATLRTEEVAPREPALVMARRRLRPYVPLLLVVVAAFGLRTFTAHNIHPLCTSSQEKTADTAYCFSVGGDPLNYELVGIALSVGRGFTNLGHPTAQHPPAFYTEVAVLDRLGLHSFRDKQWGYSVVGSLAVLAVGLLAHRLGGRRGPLVGCLAAGVAAFYPMFVFNDTFGKSESLYLLVTMLALLTAYRLHRQPTWRNALLTGFVLGVCWLTRTEAALLIPFIILPILLHRRLEPRRLLLIGGTVIATACLLVLPWLVYNHNRFEEPVLFTTNVGQTLVLGGCDQVFYGELIGWYSFGCFEDTRLGGSGDDHVWDESVADRRYREQGFAYFDDNRGQIPWVLAARLGRMWNVYRPLQTVALDTYAETRSYGAVLATLLIFGSLVPFAAVGLWRLWRRRIPISPMVATFVLASAVAMFAAPQLRFRVPADGAIIVLASLAIVWLAYGSERGGEHDISDDDTAEETA